MSMALASHKGVGKASTAVVEVGASGSIPLFKGAAKLALYYARSVSRRTIRLPIASYCGGGEEHGYHLQCAGHEGRRVMDAPA